jgi:hypothetical protein
VKNVPTAKKCLMCLLLPQVEMNTSPSRSRLCEGGILHVQLYIHSCFPPLGLAELMDTDPDNQSCYIYSRFDGFNSPNADRNRLRIFIFT